MSTDPDDDDPDREQYSVAIFFRDGRYFYAMRWVTGEVAVRGFRRFCEGPQARAGLWHRIIVTDGGDFTNMEWKHGEGYTYPPELVRFNGAR